MIGDGGWWLFLFGLLWIQLGHLSIVSYAQVSAESNRTDAQQQQSDESTENNRNTASVAEYFEALRTGGLPIRPLSADAVAYNQPALNDTNSTSSVLENKENITLINGCPLDYNSFERNGYCWCKCASSVTSFIY